ncbi:RNA polymerase II transcription factor SIII (Elongin) subunit A, putative [Trichophyton benhamiae CBS 112371]|uniref:RNA polymerase II transcription factor SIII (Elongin) subunit A, putative n=1 Tax=Arthroderma benhamiae (strain ATCC MYA-4681 / CBS 112371) TaxID=663331 RepID=D4ALN5_ARTBC|nr:RNA polymerase II transcription factor SIII (Elongin) subunit A, putative [Trichophyton benhamiae CBS 112371]EFE36294.1 RNA polymerase II transcription factor SIII (Elongin) subunit A, putative [Trichophyton benhamiae CBS 112371]
MARRMCVKVVRGEYSIHTFMICILSLSSFQLTVNKLEITDVGLARYEIIRPILQKIENPQQLYELEQRSPHLLEHDAELWIEFIKRDIYFWETLDLTEPPESWYQFYTSLREQAAKKVDEDAERMKRALQGLDKEKLKHTPKLVDVKQMRLPREKPTTVQRHAHHDRMMGGISPIFALGTKSSDPSNGKPWEDRPQWRLVPPKLSSRSNSGASSGARKSALPAAVKRNNRLSTPTHKLNTMASRIIKAPKSFIEDHQKNSSPINRSTRPPIRSNVTTVPFPKPAAIPQKPPRGHDSTPDHTPTDTSIHMSEKLQTSRSVRSSDPKFKPTLASARTSSDITPGPTGPNVNRGNPTIPPHDASSSRPELGKKRQGNHTSSRSTLSNKQKRLKVS